MERSLLRREFNRLRKETGVGWEIIEQDYALSWILYGISKTEKLHSSLIFKGGTALKKVYFGNYRFSQDLDFSVRGDHPKGDELEQLVNQACKTASEHLDSVEFICRRYLEREEHPDHQEAFVIQARFPWHRDYNTSVKVEVTTQEKVLLEPQSRKILHGYGESLNGTIFSYQIEEIIAEKIRAILQFAKKLHERGWGRSRVRDYYDLWRILNEYEDSLNKAILPHLISEKCALKKINFTSIEDLFQDRLMEHLKEWDLWLAPIVPNLPKKSTVLKELFETLSKLL